MLASAGPMNDYHNRLLNVIKAKAPMDSAPIKEWEMGDLSEARARHLTNAMQAHSFAAAIVRYHHYTIIYIIFSGYIGYQRCTKKFKIRSLDQSRLLSA